MAGVDSVTIGETNGTITQLSVVLDGESQSEEAYASINALRVALDEVAGADALVGGLDAQALDVKDAYAHDQLIVIPLILILVFIVLVILAHSLHRFCCSRPLLHLSLHRWALAGTYSPTFLVSQLST